MLIGLFGAYSLIPSTTCPCGTYACLHWRQSRTPGSLTLVFFFLHCRSSTRHGRSTTGILSRWKRISGRNSPGGQKTTSQTKTQTKNPNTPPNKHKTTAPPPGKFAKLSETRWNKTRPSQPLIGSLPPCSNPPRHPLFRCQPYLHLHLYPQAGL